MVSGFQKKLAAAALMWLLSPVATHAQDQQQRFEGMNSMHGPLTFSVQGKPAMVLSPNGSTSVNDLTANSLTISDAANNNAITSFLFPNGQAWFSNNLYLGNSNFGYTNDEMGPAIYFGGTSGDNSDQISLYRHNILPNWTELRLSIGDDSRSATQCDGNGQNCLPFWDSFVIGGTDFKNNNEWVPRFVFTTVGGFGIGTGMPLAALDIQPTEAQFNSYMGGMWIEGNLLNPSQHRRIGIFTDEAQGAWNSLTQAGDNLILFKVDGNSADSPNANGLVIGPWSMFAHGIRMDANGNVGVGTAAPQATLDVNGFVRLALNSAAPAVCDANHYGSLALTHVGQACVCSPQGNAWVRMATLEACQW